MEESFKNLFRGGVDCGRDLDKYKGQKVEIIILPFESPVYEFDKEYGEEAEARLEAFDSGLIEVVDAKDTVEEFKEKYF